MACLWGGGALLLLLFLWLVLSWWQDAAPRLVRVELWPQGSVHIGDVVRYRAIVACPATSLPLVPFEVKLPDGVQALDEQRRVCGLGLNSVRWACDLRVQPFDLTVKGKGALKINVSSGRVNAGTAVTAELPGLSVKARLKTDEQALRVAKPIAAPWWPRSLAWWHLLLALALAAAAGWAVWRWLIRPVPTSGPPPEPCWDLARRAMQWLEDALPLSAEEFFVRLTDILRRYCEARFGIRATETTTPEFLAMIRGDSTLSAEQRRALEDFLRAADEVKFAKGDATQEQLLGALRTARQFVTESVPVIPPRAG
jgi:hypothetical protein